MELEYDIILATRNRVDALRMSIPLILAQTRLPNKIVFVDASTSTGLVHDTIQKLMQESSISFEFVSSSRANLPYQRNLGLERVMSPIVILPDDDSLLYPDATENMLRVYERDVDGIVGGVCSAEAVVSPLDQNQKVYQKRLIDKIKRKLQPARNRFENRYFTKVSRVYAENFWRSAPIPGWLDQENAVLVEDMAGFRMSYRTDVIREFGYDEILGSRSGYAQHEDIDASISAMRLGKVLVGARNAKIYHHKFPASRADDFTYGFFWVANYLYIFRKACEQDSKVMKSLSKYMRYKLFLYSLVRNESGRRKYEGAKTAWTHRHLILDYSKDPAEQYQKMHQLCLGDV